VKERAHLTAELWRPLPSYLGALALLASYGFCSCGTWLHVIVVADGFPEDGNPARDRAFVLATLALWTAAICGAGAWWVRRRARTRSGPARF
jgi:hypothetical protein